MELYIAVPLVEGLSQIDTSRRTGNNLLHNILLRVGLSTDPTGWTCRHLHGDDFCGLDLRGLSVANPEAAFQVVEDLCFSEPCSSEEISAVLLLGEVLTCPLHEQAGTDAMHVVIQGLRDTLDETRYLPPGEAVVSHPALEGVLQFTLHRHDSLWETPEPLQELDVNQPPLLGQYQLTFGSNGFLRETANLGDDENTSVEKYAPALAGFLYDRYGPDAVFYLAYALIGLNIMISLVAVNKSPIAQSWPGEEGEGLLEPTTPTSGYGTMPSGMRDSSGSLSRSVSPTAPPPRVRTLSMSLPAALIWSPRLSIALGGYLVFGLLVSALQSVIPLFVKRHYGWSAMATGYTFIPLSVPAALVGFLSGALAARVPKSVRFLTAIGFLACLPAFLYLGQVRENTAPVQHAFFLTLSGLSFAIGLSGDPLVREIMNIVSSSASDSWSATAQAMSLPQLANAWGTLLGPIFAGGVHWVSGWQTMSTSLALVAGAAGVASLLFLQGWIGNPHPKIRNHHAEASADEESAPLLGSSHVSRNLFGHPEANGSSKADFHIRRQSSDEVSPHTRSAHDSKHRPSRRHFSVDNFSVASTAAPGSLDSSTSSIRFQAALETPVQGASAPHKRPQTSDSTSKASAERRYVMREAPHAPATDPLLAAGSLYVIDEERDTARGVESERQKRRVVVFAEGTAPPDLLRRHRHHVVAINALDGTAQMVGDATHNHAVHVTEETGEEEPEFEEGRSRRTCPGGEAM
ncbi:hypothetical protein N0V88_006552 [Collariella sp. IMI 366227]|nr:hypothetical protein N0V88_006552 [Collariella sp. IMI 366227]